MMKDINREVLAMCHCIEPNPLYPLLHMQNFFERDEILKTLQCRFPRIFRLGQNFPIKYKSSLNLSAENLQLKFFVNQKLCAVKEAWLLFGTPDICHSLTLEGLQRSLDRGWRCSHQQLLAASDLSTGFAPSLTHGC